MAHGSPDFSSHLSDAVVEVKSIGILKSFGTYVN
jgi:hypothetical protein